jgi:hypothetical protein
VDAEQHEPDDRSGPVEPTRVLERMAVKEAHRDAAREEHDRRRNEQRR